MHYIPPSLTEIAPPTEAQRPDAPNPAIPLYVLTGVVGILLGTDTILSWIDSPAWNVYRSFFGFRLALLAAVLAVRGFSIRRWKACLMAVSALTWP